MGNVQNGSIKYYRFDHLTDEHLVQAIFTRHGGTSQTPWQSLNMGGTVGDDPAAVTENRLRGFSALGLAPETLYDVWQVHSANVVCADTPRSLKVPHLKADVILTDHPGVTLMMRFADCVPIFLYDPRRGVIGLAHAGWKGTVQRVAAAAVETMQTRYGCNPADIQAGIGPSIGVDHYPIGPEVAAQVREAFGRNARPLLQPVNGKVHLDLWEANRLTLEQAGVGQIELAGICTACHVEDWYSHRAENGHTGRFGALFALSD